MAACCVNCLFSGLFLTNPLVVSFVVLKLFKLNGVDTTKELKFQTVMVNQTCQYLDLDLNVKARGSKKQGFFQ